MELFVGGGAVIAEPAAKGLERLADVLVGQFRALGEGAQGHDLAGLGQGFGSKQHGSDAAITQAECSALGDELAYASHRITARGRLQ